MKQMTIIPYLVNHPEKQKIALILAKQITYELKALGHMIKNTLKMNDLSTIIRMLMRIMCQMALIISLISAYSTHQKYIFGGVVTYFWAEPIGNGMYKIPSYGQKLLNAPL